MTGNQNLKFLAQVLAGTTAQKTKSGKWNCIHTCPPHNVWRSSMSDVTQVKFNLGNDSWFLCVLFLYCLLGTILFFYPAGIKLVLFRVYVYWYLLGDLCWVMPAIPASINGMICNFLALSPYFCLPWIYPVSCTFNFLKGTLTTISWFLSCAVTFRVQGRRSAII